MRLDAGAGVQGWGRNYVTSSVSTEVEYESVTQWCHIYLAAKEATYTARQKNV